MAHNTIAMRELYFSPQVAKAIDTLHHEYRIKLLGEYAITQKYGELRVFCSKVFKQSIVEVFEAANIKITSITTYG